MALKFLMELEFRNVDFYGGRKTREPGENPQGKGEYQQQTQPTCDTRSRIWTQATLVVWEMLLFIKEALDTNLRVKK